MLLLLLKLVESQREQQLLSFQSKTAELPIITNKQINQSLGLLLRFEVNTVMCHYLYNIFCKRTCKGMFYTVDLPAQSVVFWILDSVNRKMYTLRNT